MIGPYQQPLYYDILHTPGSAGEVSAMVRIARRFLGRGDRAWTVRTPLWIEPACGTGRLLQILGRRSATAIGIDIVPGMVDFANERFSRLGLKTSRALVGDMRRMASPLLRAAVREQGKEEGPAQVVAFCPHNSIRHLDSDTDIIAHLESMRRLMSGARGIYLVGIGLVGPGGEAACETVALARRGSLTIREVVDFVMPDANARGRAARIERAYRHLAVSSKGEEREWISNYPLRTYTLPQWQNVVGAAGMSEIAVIGAWGESIPVGTLRYAWRVLTPAGRKSQLAVSSPSSIR